MKEPHLLPPFVLADGRLYLILDWEPDRDHRPATIRPLTDVEADLVRAHRDDSMWGREVFCGA